MSLELAINENTKAVRDLIAAIANGLPTTQAQVAAVVTESKAKPAKAAKPMQEEPAEEVTTEAPKHEEAAPVVTQESKAESAVAEDKPVVAYADAAKAITDLSKAKGRDAAIAVLNQFGAAKLPDVKAEHFSDVIDACAKAMAA